MGCEAVVEDFFKLHDLNYPRNNVGDQDREEIQPAAVMQMTTGMSSKPEAFVKWIADGMINGFIGVNIYFVLNGEPEFSEYLRRFEVPTTMDISKHGRPGIQFGIFDAALVVGSVVALCVLIHVVQRRRATETKAQEYFSTELTLSSESEAQP